MPDPIITSPFASPEELAAKSKGRIPEDDPDAEGALTAASQRIRDYAGWHIWPQVSEVIHLNGPGLRELFLPTLFLASITSITDDGETVTVADLDYNVGKLTDGIIDGRCWSTKRGAVVATIVHGHPVVPAGLRYLTMQMAARALGSPLGATKEASLSSSVSWSLTGTQKAGGVVLLDDEHAEIDAYRIPGRT